MRRELKFVVQRQDLRSSGRELQMHGAAEIKMVKISNLIGVDIEFAFFLI